MPAKPASLMTADELDAHLEAGGFTVVCRFPVDWDAITPEQLREMSGDDPYAMRDLVSMLLNPPQLHQTTQQEDIG